MQNAASYVLALCLFSFSACARQCTATPGHRKPSVKVHPGLALGNFRLRDKHPIVDGDTIRVEGLPASLRLLCIDTEETFKSWSNRALYRQGWEIYLQDKMGHARRPPKFPTPLGEKAKEFARKFFEGVTEVRLERDHPKLIRGAYNRFLVYVFAKKGARFVNYNIEAVRAGMSPYFTKYGYSRRFHREFVAAQEEARRHRRGIWNPKLQHYPDYEDRIEYWNSRADFIAEFERDASGRDDMVSLGEFDALRRIRARLGKEVEVLGIVGKVIRRKGVTIVLLSRRKYENFPVVFFDRDVYEASGIARFRGEYVRVRGKARIYRHRGQKTLEIVVRDPKAVKGSEKTLAFLRNYVRKYERLYGRMGKGRGSQGH